MKILVIDGNSIANRAFYGIKMLTTKDGRYTNAIVGFLNILNRLIEAEAPDGVAVAWDVHAPTFRHKKYGEYKAGRKGTPQELLEQMPVIKNIIDALGYRNIELEGFEADDILGTISRACATQNCDCVIATGDRDSLQLVSEKTRVLLSATKIGRPEITEYNTETLYNEYGVSPEGMIEIKALKGDSSDNIPGVAGVGDKTAGDLIKNFGNIDYIYDNIDSLDIKEGVKNKLIAGKESAYLSRELGTIFCDVPIECDAMFYKKREVDKAALAEILFDRELFKAAERYGVTAADINAEKVYITDSTELTQTDDVNKVLNSKDIELVLFEDSAVITNGEFVCKISLETFNDVISNPEIAKSVYDSKAVYKYCIKNSLTPENVVFDTLLAAYLLEPSSNDYSLDTLAAEYRINSGEFENLNVKAAAQNSQLARVLAKQIKDNGLEELLNKIELPLAYVLASMETEGVLIDVEGTKKYGDALNEKIENLRSEITGEIGYEFNLNSPKQLGKALFEDLGLPCKKKTKSGYSTNAEVLESLRYDYPVVEKLLEYRTLAKLKSTYCDGLVAAACDDCRIRSTLNQTETRTGRISSSEPNLQNIPVKKQEGKELRRFFKAREGYVLCDADYSQIELRVLASIANDKAMIEAFNNNIDIHTLTASQVFNMPLQMVTPLMRSRAKAVNFGIVYGIGAFSLSKDIGVTKKEADEYIKGYFSTYPQVDMYMKSVVDNAKANGYVSTLFGRKRLLPELSNSNRMIQSFGERVARNMPIQGTAADIIKIAMINVSNRLKVELPNARLIMQVHDELLVEAPKEQVEIACKIIKEEMESAVKLSVPLIVDVNYGDTWYDAKG